MKRFVSVAVPAILLFGSSIPGFAQDAKSETWKKGDMWDETIRQQVKLRLDNAKTSDQLIALSRAADFNVFADATHFSASSQPVSLEMENELRDWIFETASQERLSWLRTEERTFLFWTEPDVVQTVKSLVAEIKSQRLAKATAQTDEKGTKETPPLRLLGPSQGPFQITKTQEMGIFLADYLQKQRGWDGKSPNLQLEFKLSELPPEAAAELLSIARSTINRSNQSKRQSWMRDADWLSGEIWPGARLLYASPFAKMKPILAVKGTLSNMETFQGLENSKIFSRPAPARQAAAEIPDGQPQAENFPLLRQEELQREVSLARPVTFEVKEATVSDLLAQMQDQGGVTLKISPHLLSRQRVTARVSTLPLYRAMNALSRLYGVGWAKAPDGSYSVQSDLSPVRAQALQIGAPEWFSYWRSRAIRQEFAPPRLILDERVDWEGEFLKAGVDEAALRAPNGVAVSVLPAELQSLIRRAVEETYALRLMRDFDDAFARPEALLEGHEEDVMVRVRPPETPTAMQMGRGRMIATTPPLRVDLVDRGEAVYNFSVPGPQARQVVQETIRRRHEWEERIEQMRARRRN